MKGFILATGDSDILTIFLLFSLQAHLVAAFEKSLGNMTGRLQSLTMTAEQKVWPVIATEAWKKIVHFAEC